jgi:hypothetical protein
VVFFEQVGERCDAGAPGGAAGGVLGHVEDVGVGFVGSSSAWHR